MKVKWQSDTPNMELKVPSEIKIDGYIPTAQDLKFTGEQASGLFQHGRFSWVLEHYTSLLSFSNVQKADYCFYSLKSDTNLTNLTFYMKDGYSNNIGNMFYQSNLPHLPHIVGAINNCSELFRECHMKSIPDNFFDNFIFKKKPSFYSTYISCSSIFQGCKNLTKVPSLKAFKQLDLALIPTSAYGNFYYYLFNACSSLQEVRDLPIVYGINSEVKQNFLVETVGNAEKLSSFTFEPNQTARLSDQFLYLGNTGYKIDYYNRYRKDSVYNHDSAVETINSLPDTSAFLAEVGGTNTIKFYSDQGANTEGGAIGNLTAEEIAVAAAKGWTVAFGN